MTPMTTTPSRIPGGLLVALLVAVGLTGCAEGERLPAVEDAALSGGDAHNRPDTDETRDASSCESDEIECGGTCIDPTSNRNHCGGCESACSGAEVCSDGTCRTSCPGSQTLCEGGCYSLSSSDDHCGSCGNTCASGESCREGECAVSCSSDLTRCGESCVDTSTRTDHCGSCDTSCEAGEVCEQGSCILECPDGQQVCNGQCVDPQSNDDHCGECANACGEPEACVSGTCELDCPSGETACSGTCVDTSSSDEHCGSCGNACPSGERCASGSCKLDCPSGQTACSGNCIDTSTNRDHCGGCGNACGATETCTGGNCQSTCASHETSCSSECVDTSSHRSHCGSCGNACSGHDVCTGGSCEEASLSVLIYHDGPDFEGGNHPAELAATTLGWSPTVVYEQGPTFQTFYNSQSWDIVVIDASVATFPPEVGTVAENRAGSNAPLIFNFYGLDGNSSLKSALGVGTTTYGNPQPVSPATGASVDFFNYEESIPSPLSSTGAGLIDNGDFLTLSAGGEIVMVEPQDTKGLAAVTNNQSSLVLGFLPLDFANLDADGDSMTDMTELYLNILLWIHDK